MAAEVDRTYRAQQACLTCKTRKKGCNKFLPSCGYCTSKGLNCLYGANALGHADDAIVHFDAAPVWSTTPSLGLVSSRTFVSEQAPSDSTTAEMHRQMVYSEVLGIIRETGQFVDDIIARYFQGFHPFIPIISRARFHDNLIASRAAPPADVSVLLLTLCLITHIPALGYRPEHHSPQTRSKQRRSIHLAVRSLLTQVQISCSISLALIQASVLLAMYEYMHGRPEDAFITISTSVRMAYATRLHRYRPHQTETVSKLGRNPIDKSALQVEEAANTWWGIVICERIFFSELAVSDQPLVTAFPGSEARLPIDPQHLDQLDILDPGSVPNISVSCLTSPKTGGFGRTAQATNLLDQVLRAFEIRDLSCRLLLLDRLSTSVQSFLSLAMSQCQESPGRFCTAMHIALKTLFKIHWHILDHRAPDLRIEFVSLEEWRQRSEDALDTVTNIVRDLAESLIAATPGEKVTNTMDFMPPIYPYVVCSALRHIQDSSQNDAKSKNSAESVLHATLTAYLHRWVESDNWPRVGVGAKR